MHHLNRPNRALKTAEKIGILLLILISILVALFNQMYLYAALLPILALLHFYPLLEK